MANPFDFSTADPSAPGPLGLPLGAWRDLAQFGGNLAQAANARTAGGFLANGPGLAGPLGAAITGTMEQGRQNAVTRSALNLQGAQARETQARVPYIQSQTNLNQAQVPLTEAQTGLAGATTQGKNIENTLAAFGIPAAAARAQIQQRALTDPTFLPKFLEQLLGPQQPGAQPSQIPSGPGRQGANVIPDDQRGAMLASAVEGTPVPPHILGGLVDRESSWKLGSVDPSSGAFGLTAALPSTAADPGYGVSPLSANASPQEQLSWGARYLAARGQAAGVKDWNDPRQVATALTAYHGPATDANGIGGTQYAQEVLQRSGQFLNQNTPRQSLPAGSYNVAQAGDGPLPKPSLGGMTAQGTTPGQATTMGQQFLRQADDLDRRANMMQVGSGLTGLPMGDPAALRTQAQQTRALGQQLLSAGPVEAAKAGGANIEMRPGAMSRVMGPNGVEWIKNPQLEKRQMEDGSTQYVHISPAPPDSPPGTPPIVSPVVDDNGQPVVEKLPPNLQDARNHAYTQFAGKDADAFIAAKNTQGLLTQMNEAADVLNKAGGFLGTGPTAPERIGFASKVNDVLRTVGLPEAFNPGAVAQWEELVKATRTAGFELASHYEGHARQAAQTIENATSAVPSERNSPIGFYKVSAGINEIAQQTADAHEFKTHVYNQSGDLSKAETEFYTKYPAQMYARRAISTTSPYPVKNEKELNRYLPGTYIKLPDGTLGQVPERPGAPGVPDYIRSHQIASPAGGQQ